MASAPSASSSESCATGDKTLKIRISKEQILALKSPNRPTSTQRTRATPAPAGSPLYSDRAAHLRHRTAQRERSESTDSVSTVVYGSAPRAAPLTRTKSYLEFPTMDNDDGRGRAQQRDPTAAIAGDRAATPAPSASSTRPTTDTDDAAGDTDVDMDIDTDGEHAVFRAPPATHWTECGAGNTRYLLARAAPRIPPATLARHPSTWSFADAHRYNPRAPAFWGPGRFALRLEGGRALTTVWDVQPGTCCVWKCRLVLHDRLAARTTTGGGPTPLYAAPPVVSVELDFWAARPGEPETETDGRTSGAAYARAGAAAGRAPWRIAFTGQRVAHADLRACKVDMKSVALADAWKWEPEHAVSGRVSGAHEIHVCVPVPAAQLRGWEYRRFRVRARVVLAVPELGLEPVEACAPVADVAFECLTKERHMDGKPLLHKISRQ